MPEQSSQAILTKRSGLRIFFGTVFFCVLSGNYCLGQLTSRVLVTAPREYQRVLDLAQRDLDNEEYASAIERLERLLHGEADESLKEDFFVGSANSARFESSLRSRAEKMLANLPPKARELYELQFGADARLALDTALNEFDVTKLSAVRRRYSATEAGMLATMILGRHYLNAQRPMAALMCFKQLYASEVSRTRYGAELSLLLAIAARRSGQEVLASKTLVELKEANPDATYQFDGQQTKLFASDGDAIDWLDKLIGRMSDGTTIPISDWLTHRGNNQRNAESTGSMPLLNFLWEVNITTNPRDIEYVREMREASMQGAEPLVPSIQPLVTANTAFIRGPRRLVAVDIKTGKRIWDFVWHRQSVDIASAQSESNRRQQVRYRLLEDAVYGRLASDGELLFLVGQPRTNQNNYQTFQPNGIGVQFGQSTPSSNQPNLLIALDIAAEGKYRWKVGGRTGEQEPALAGLFFLGPPIAVDDELYVIGDRNNEIGLYALDRATGKLKWSQQLAHSTPRARYTYFSHRRRAGAVPSYANGVLVCPTSSGAIVAVDVASRSLLWGYQYPIDMNRRPPSRNSSSTTWGKWLDSSVTISAGKVVVTPVESSYMHCLNLADGKSVWTTPVKRADQLHVASVHDGIVCVVGKHAMTGFNLDSGKQEWNTSINIRDRNDGVKNLPAGFGFRSGDHYFLPTNDGILKVHVATGEISESITCEESLGNLVPYQDKVISLGLDFLRLYHQTDRLAAAVEAKLKQSPNDPWALEQRGALYFDGGNVNAGLRALRKAIKSYPAEAPERDRARRLLVSVALVALEQDYLGNLELAEELQSWIDRPEDRQRYLLLQANGMLAAKEPLKAFSAFSQLVFAKRPKNARYATIPRDDKAQHMVRQDRAIRAGISAALSMASAADSRKMLAELQSRCDDLLSQRDTTRIRSTIDELGNLPVTDGLRVYAAKQLASEQPAIAELLLLPVLDSQDPQLAAEAYRHTAEIYTTADFHRAAARCYEIARENWPQTKLPDGKTVGEICDSFPPTSSVGRYLRNGTKWLYGATKFERGQKAPGGRGPSLLVSLVQQKSNGDEHAPTLDFWHDRNDLVATDRLGRERIRVSAGSYQRHTLSTRPSTSRQLGSVCFVNVGNLVTAVDNLQPIDPTKSLRQRRIPVLWPDYQTVRQNRIAAADIGRRPVWKQSVKFPRNREVYEIATASANGLVYLRNRQLVCVDPLTGDILWTRDDIKSNSRVWGDDSHVFVAGVVSARAFDLSDGSELPEVDIPTPERRWTTIGRNIVAWENGKSDGNSTRRVLCLYDPLTQKNIWQYECQYSSPTTAEDGEETKVGGAGCIADDEFAFIIEPSGQSFVIDLATGKRVGEYDFELPTDQRLVGAKLIVSDDQFTVAALLQLQTDPHFTMRKPNNDTSINEGFIQAINRRTGKAQWSSAVRIDRFGLLENQPRDLPVLLFARKQRAKPPAQAVPWRADVVCLDRRDGRRLFDIAPMKISSSEYRMQASSEQGIDFRFPNNDFYRLQFSGDPVAPAPPAPVAINHPPPKPKDTSAKQPPKLGPRIERILDDDDPFDLNR